MSSHTLSARPPVIATPISIGSTALLNLHAAHPQRYPFLLESAAQGGTLGRFDILFAHPGKRIVLRADGSLVSDSSSPSSRFLDALDGWFQHERIAAVDSELPFTGGWFLFLGYELAGQIEPSLQLSRDPAADIAQAVRIPAAIVRRQADGAAWLVVESSRPDLQAAIATDIRAADTERTQYRGPLLARPLQEDAPEIYLAMVQAVLAHIAAGDIYQANLSRGWRAELKMDVSAHDLYRRLRLTNPAPFAGLAAFGDRAIISSSPERLLEVRQNMISTRPIAGTQPRHQDRTDDKERRSELHAHPKERAEHIMLIDLERNDLGRICQAGSVEVNEFMTLESYAHVHHIVSNVRGILRAGVTPGQTIAAVFPGGTITGCPKVRCMQIIADNERVARGAYTGSMGYLNRDGSMDLNILIRTLELRGRDLNFRAGGGIVADSVPARELEETRAKARGLIKALDNS